MPAAPKTCRVVILVKAVPRPSKKYGETVCCAGVTEGALWKRLYPIRFRHLSDDTQFARWNWVSFGYRPPTNDPRKESCHVFEDTIVVDGSSLRPDGRAEFLDRTVVGSGAEASVMGQSLALIRPRNTRFVFKRKPQSVIASEKTLFERAGQQASFFDADLRALEPTPFAFAFHFEDRDGRHTYQCGDWETHAMFRRWRARYGEAKALQDMMDIYNDDYPKRGMAFAIGTVLKRPHIWQLLGVLRLDASFQTSLPLE